VLHALQPAVDPAAALQHVAGVEVRRWERDADAWPTPGAVVIEAFGCGLPDGFVAALAALPVPPVWVTTEYLSAESWVPSHHGLASPHPATGIARWFFFPGFVTGTGGVLREAGYEARRQAAQGAAHAARLWADLGFAPTATGATNVSLFGYANAALPALVKAWSEGAAPIVAAVTRCPLVSAVATVLGAEGRPGELVRRGSLEVRFLPFMAQGDYDRLLWSADWNFVRGEDSLCRAVWARRPLVWQPYVQPAGAHAAKLAAFADWYVGGTPVAGAWLRFASAWSGLPEGSGVHEEVGSAWAGLAASGAALQAQADGRAEALAGVGEFTAQLVDFCRKRLN
jgi:uncharacterized repeat protein (TIGR03837 family)